MFPQNPVLTTSDLCISFGTSQEAVKDLSFTLLPGQTLAIVGESGSGKSLTALSLAGLLPKTARTKGQVLLHTPTGTASLLDLPDGDWPRLRGAAIGMVFQEPMSALNPVMRIGRQLQESIRTHRRLRASEARSAALSWLRRVKLAEALYDRFPHQLSGGQKQRVMIAMAMCCEPVLLIADEPTTALDATVQQEIVQLMKELQHQSGTALIFITHDLELAAGLSDQIMVLYHGSCVESGPTAAVLNAPQHAYTRALLACRPSADQKGKRLAVVGDFLEQKEPVPVAKSAAAAGSLVTDKESLLLARDLEIWFPERHNLLGKTTAWFKAVNGVSFELHPGETLGLVGESGCGKSTLGRSLLGLVPLHSGELYFDQNPIHHYKGKAWNSLRKELQLIFQDPFASLNPRMTVSEIIAEPLLVHHLLSPKAATAEAINLLAQVQMPASAAQRYPHQFSGGQRQRIGIARALALKPKVLVCDESVSALDISVQAQILNLLRDLQAELGLSYLFISHDLSVVHYMSDRVLVMQQGKILESGTAGQVLLQPQHPYTRRLIAAMPGRIAG